jgi:hypothetical protein
MCWGHLQANTYASSTIKACTLCRHADLSCLDWNALAQKEAIFGALRPTHAFKKDRTTELCENAEQTENSKNILP